MRYPYLTLIAVFCLTVSAAAADTAGKVKSQVTEAIQTRQQTQRREDTWDAERARLQAEYTSLQSAGRQLEEEHQRLAAEVKARRSSIAGMQGQIQALQRISSELSPYLDEVLKQLGVRVQNGLPFARAQRRQRIERLKRQLADPHLPVSVKFRNLSEALLVEARYGDSVDVTTRPIVLGGRTIVVQVLRLGRLALFFLTLDRKTAGVYDPAASGWKTVPARYNENILRAIQISAKQRSAELLSLPLGKIAP